MFCLFLVGKLSDYEVQTGTSDSIASMTKFLNTMMKTMTKYLVYFLFFI